MPEGDNILHVAAVLGRELTGRTLDALELQDQGVVEELAGRRIERIDTYGKHMFVHLEGGWSVRVHLGMNGRWRRRHVRQPRPRDPTVVIVSGETAYICDRAYRAETIRTAALRRHPRLTRLGPDLLSDPPPIAEAVRRAAFPGNAGREIADLLLDQRVAAGIGNIYKSEVLFECRIHPRTPVHRLSRDALTAVFEKAAHLMRLNLLIRRRSAAPLRRPAHASPKRARLWVYGRAGKPCLDCGTPVQRFLQGDMARSTYFCPGCQPLR